MSFLESLGEGLTSGDFLSGAFSAVANTAANLLASGMQEDQNDEALARQDKQNMLELQLQALKARYGGGGGGGGGGGASNKVTPAQRIAALQNQGESQQNAINSLITALQNGFLAGGR